MRTREPVKVACAAMLSIVGFALPVFAADEPSPRSKDAVVDARLPIFDAHIHYAHDACEMLGKNKNLWSDLAYRTDMGSGGQVHRQWLELIQRFPDRFMVGTDTFTPERLLYIGDHANYSRGWWAALPKELAERVAFRNGDALLGLVWKKP